MILQQKLSTCLIFRKKSWNYFMLLEFHEISVQKFFSLLTMVMCEKHCFQTNKKKKKYQMAFVDLVIHKGTTTDSFIIVEEMDSIKKNCRVISRKKKSQYIISSANKTKQTKNYRKRNFDLTFWFLFKHHIVGILYPPFSRVISPSKRKIQKKNLKKSESSYFSEDIRLREHTLEATPT